METKIVTSWKDGMHFESQIGEHHLSMDLDPPLGHNRGPTPKELLATSVAGCTGMDVVGLLKKFKQVVKKMEIEIATKPSEIGYPVVFDYVHLVYRIEGDVDADKAREAVHLSQTKYCGISAMLSASVIIRWQLIVNGKDSGSGEADFMLTKE